MPCSRNFFTLRLTLIGRDAEGPNDLALLATALTNQLGREHAKGRVVLLGVSKNGPHAQVVRPLPVLAHDAEKIIDPGGTIGDQRQ